MATNATIIVPYFNLLNEHMKFSDIVDLFTITVIIDCNNICNGGHEIEKYMQICDLKVTLSNKLVLALNEHTLR